MTTFFPAPPPASSSSSASSPPAHQSLAQRGRRPALIPHNADLSLSLSAASAALTMASYSPGREKGAISTGGLWVLPPPDYGVGEGIFKESWRDDVESQDYAQGYGKAELRRASEEGVDEMDVDEEERGVVERDVFSWVNSTSDADYPYNQYTPSQQQKHGYFTQSAQESTKAYASPPPPKHYPSTHLNSRSIPLLRSTGVETAPTSPMSGNFPEALEAQRRRVEAAEKEISKNAA